MKCGIPLAPITKNGTAYVPRSQPFITKYGTPLAPITKYGTAYVPRSHIQSLRNMEALMATSQSEETLMS